VNETRSLSNAHETCESLWQFLLAANFVGSIQWPNPENRPTDSKDLADISSRSRVMAHFSPNFVAMATRESPG